MARELIARVDAIDRRDFEALRHDIIGAKSERDQIVKCAWVWDPGTGAHYPAVETDDSSDHSARSSASRVHRLTYLRAKELRKKVILLNQRTQGLFHVRVINSQSASAHPELGDAEAPQRRRAAS